MKLQINLPFSMWNYRLSGVYKITFSDSTFYIGGSVHLRSRAAQWGNIAVTGKGTPGKDVGTNMLNKIRESSFASLDIVELCSKEDVKDRESFYLDKHKEDKKMLSSDDNGAWKAVLQYKEDGLFIKKHYSISAAARYNKTTVSGIQRVLAGERSTCKGMVFIYEHDYHKRRVEIVRGRYKQAERKNGRDVLMIDSNGVVVKRFKKIADAAKEMGRRPASITRVLSGYQNKCNGFVFKYVESGM